MSAPVWKDRESMPADRPVLVWSPVALFGPRFGVGTVYLAQRGNGQRGGLWVGREFFADEPPADEVGSEVFTLWAEIPDLDATQ